LLDVLAWRKKFGVLLPSTNTVVEPNLHSMAVPGATAHSCRIWMDEAPGQGERPSQQPRTVANETQPAVERLLTSDPDYLNNGHKRPYLSRRSGGQPSMKGADARVQRISEYSRQCRSLPASFEHATSEANWSTYTISVQCQCRRYTLL